LAWALVLALIGVCMVLNASLVYHFHLRPLNPGDDVWNSKVYNKPYTRMAGYLIGVLFAFMTQYDTDFARNRMVRWGGYFLGCIACYCSVFLTNGFWKAEGWAVWQNVVYATFARVMFVTSVGWFMYCCYKLHGGLLREVFGAYVWVPLARLTYTAYLIHPMLMFVINYSSTTPFHYSGIYATVRYTSHLMLAYSGAMFFHLCVEKPTANLERILLPHDKKKH